MNEFIIVQLQNVDDFLIAGLGGDTSHEMSLLDAAPDQEYSMAELQMIMNNESIVHEREKEVYMNLAFGQINTNFQKLGLRYRFNYYIAGVGGESKYRGIEQSVQGSICNGSRARNYSG